MRIAVLGPLEAHDGAAIIDISGARLRRLLTMLAVEAPRAVSPMVLVDAVWADEPPADETNALQSLVSRLRRTLGDGDIIKQNSAGYRLAIDADDIDLNRFDQLSRDGREALRRHDADGAVLLLDEALDLWRGDPVDLAMTPPAAAVLARLDEHQLDARADRAEAQLVLGQAEEVIADLEGLVAAHPLRERFATLLVEALYGAGRPAEALASYERTRSLLADELGVDPSPELQAAHREVLRADAAATAAQPRPQRKLRASLTSFVGRDLQLAQIAQLLGDGRLVTLVGPGGAGKTRLAIEAATTLRATSQPSPGQPALIGETIWLAELAPVTDPADVPQSVLGALGLREAILLERGASMTEYDATSRLVAGIADRPAVLVLDNCEHLIDAAAQLADQLLAECPGLRILATSREPLGILGEALVVVPPLGQPAADATAADALTYPAVRLFSDRAVAVQPEFAVDDHTVAAVIEIVRRLDGQPLAIELAAARLRTLPVSEIARRLSDRFRLLTGGSRTAMPRHRTLRAVVEWSWDLLSDAERQLAERLAVFSGGVTPDTATAVCGGDETNHDDIDDLLTSLVDKSLLQPAGSSSDEPRYRMLETIREFGIERMAERGELGQVRLAHAEYFATVVATADPHLRRAEQLTWIAVMTDERDNILAALKFFGDDGRAQAALDLVNNLGWYWMTLGHHGEIVTWVEFVLDIPGPTDPIKRLLAEAYYGINSVAWNARGSDEDIAVSLERLATISTQLQTVTADAPPMMTLITPIVAMFADHLDNVDSLLERALAHPDPWIGAATLTFRAARAENAGDVAGMREDAETALTIFRELGERWGMANCLQVLGQLELVEGDLSAAATAYREAISLAEALGAREDIAMMRLRLADALTRIGDHTGAREQTTLGLEAAVESGSPIEVLFSHIVEVENARITGDHETARRIRDDAVARLRSLPAAHPVQGPGLAAILTTAAKIDIDSGDLEGASAYLAEAYDHAIKSKDMPIIAGVGVAVAMYAETRGNVAQAAEILGAAAALRGADDVTQTDVARLALTLGGLPGGPNASSYAEGRSLPHEAAIARVDPATADHAPVADQARRA